MNKKINKIHFTNLTPLYFELLQQKIILIVKFKNRTKKMYCVSNGEKKSLKIMYTCQ